MANYLGRLSSIGPRGGRMCAVISQHGFHDPAAGRSSAVVDLNTHTAEELPAFSL